MAETIDLVQKREAERRRALLALAGTQPEPSGSCLDPEELACLVEGRLEPEGVEACLTHLAGCEQCYAAWRQLHQLGRQRAGSSRNWGRLLQLASRPRFLATAGSLLAVAASIAVFLNITLQTDRSTLMQLSTEPLREQKLTVPAPEPAMNTALPESRSTAPQQQPIDDSAKEKVRPAEKEAMRSLPIPPPPARSALPAAIAPAPTGGTALDHHRESINTPIAKKQVLTGRVMEAVAPEAARPADASLPALAEESAPAVVLNLEGWRRTLTTGCQGQPDADFFARLHQQGQQLLTGSTAPALSAKDRHHLEKILTLLADPHPQPTALRCQALIELLGPETRDGKH